MYYFGHAIRVSTVVYERIASCVPVLHMHVEIRFVQLLIRLQLNRGCADACNRDVAEADTMIQNLRPERRSSVAGN